MNIDNLLAAELEAQKENKRQWTGKLGDEEVTLYVSPITAHDMRMVGLKFKDFEKNPTSAAMLYLLCVKAEDENGKKVFNKGVHPKMLERLPMAFVGEILGELFADDFDEGDLDIENLEKNSETTQND